MRGSPLVRSLVLLALLAAAGAGLLRLTHGNPRPAAAAPSPTDPADKGPRSHSRTKVPFELSLSTPAALVRLLDPAGQPLFESSTPAIREVAALDLTDSTTALIVQIRWANPSAGHRFARLTLEPPGRPTLRHVFDATGDIDDAWELPAGALAPAADE